MLVELQRLSSNFCNFNIQHVNTIVYYSSVQKYRFWLMTYKGKQLGTTSKTSKSFIHMTIQTKPYWLHLHKSVPLKAAGFVGSVFEYSNFLRFWSSQFVFRNRGKKCFQDHLVKEYGGMRLSPGGKSGWPRCRQGPVLPILSMAGKARDGSRVCQQRWMPWGDGLGLGVCQEMGLGPETRHWCGSTCYRDQVQALAADQAEVDMDFLCSRWSRWRHWGQSCLVLPGSYHMYCH